MAAQNEIPGDVLQQMAAMMGTPPSDVPGLRKMLDQFAALLNGNAPEIGAVHESVLLREVDGERVTADVFVPKGKGPFPVLVYLHGGGWVAGSPATHRKLTQRFAEAGYLVVSVDYRLAPEAPFPKGFDDCVHAVRWAAENASRWGGDPKRVAIGGDSAGGNLSAAVAAHLSGDLSAPKLRAALLIYGVYDFATMRDVEATSPGVDAKAATALRDAMIYGYVGQNPPDSRMRDPRVSPLHAASKLPPSYLVCGTADELLAQQQALSAALDKAGVEHETVEIAAMPHGFVQMEFLGPALEQVHAMIGFLDKRLR